MSRHQPGSPDDPARRAEDRVALPGIPAVPPVPPPSMGPASPRSMGQVFAEMGEALAETQVAPAWRATNHYVDDTESVDGIPSDEDEEDGEDLEPPGRLGQVRRFFAERLGSKRLGLGGLLVKPSREIVVRASIGVLAAFAGWSAGAKPWQGSPEIEAPGPTAAAVVDAPRLADASKRSTAAEPGAAPSTADSKIAEDATPDGTHGAASATAARAGGASAKSTKTTVAQGKSPTPRASKSTKGKSSSKLSGKARAKAKTKRS